jgi:hypothetical protein
VLLLLLLLLLAAAALLLLLLLLLLLPPARGLRRQALLRFKLVARLCAGAPARLRGPARALRRCACAAAPVCLQADAAAHPAQLVPPLRRMCAAALCLRCCARLPAALQAQSVQS